MIVVFGKQANQQALTILFLRIRFPSTIFKMTKLCSTPELSWVLRYRLIKENRPIVICPTTQNLPKYLGSSMTFLIQWVDPKDHMLKVLYQYLYYWLRYRLNKKNRPIVIMATQSKLNQVPRVILDVLDIVSRPQGSYTESFCVNISIIG